MSKKIDKIFNQKLGNWESTPEPVAWQQLEDHLHAKRKKLFYRRIALAASLLLLFSIGYVIWNISLSTKDFLPLKTSENSIDRNPVIELNEEALETQIKEESNNESENVAELEKPGIEINEELNQTPQLATVDTEIREIKITPEVEEQDFVVINELEETMAESGDFDLEKISEPAVEEKLPPITIEYRNSPPVASTTPEEVEPEKSKGLIKKIQTIAKEVRESDIGLASLREAKDDFLAFERKKDKTEENNN